MNGMRAVLMAGGPAGGRVVAKSTEIPADVPEWIQVLPMGVVEPEGWHEFLVDDLALELIMDSFNARGDAEMVVDYEHQTLYGMEAPAAGWVKALEVRDDGLWAKVDWLDRAREYIEKREYRYISPVVWHQYDAPYRAFQLDSIALTNNPAIRDLEPVVAKARNGGDDMDKKKILELLGLSADATDDQIREGLAVLKSNNALVASVRGALSLEEGDGEDKVQAAVAALKSSGTELPAELLEAAGLEEGATADQVVQAVLKLKMAPPADPKLTQRIERLEADQLTSAVETAVQAALKAGKIGANDDALAAARQFATKDLEGFNAFVDAAPVAVPVGERVAATAAPSGDTVTEEDRQMAEMMGVDPSELKDV